MMEGGGNFPVVEWVRRGETFISVTNNGAFVLRSPDAPEMSGSQVGLYSEKMIRLSSRVNLHCFLVFVI